MNYFELYPGDYLRDTGELSLAQHGAYLLLMASCYSTENGLPADPVGLFRITRAMTPEEQEATLAVAERFFPIAEDGRRHSWRIDTDIDKAKARIESARTNGAKGGRPKKPTSNQNETEKKPTGFPLGSNPGNPNETQKKAHQTPYTTTTSEIDTPAGATSAGDAGKAMRNAGVATLNLSHPDFLAALNEGVTPDEFANAVDAAKDRGIGGAGLFTYAVGIARTTHARSAQVIDLPSARAGPGPDAPSKTLQSIQTLQDTAYALIEQSTATRAALGYPGADEWSGEASDPRLGGSSGS